MSVESRSAPVSRAPSMDTRRPPESVSSHTRAPSSSHTTRSPRIPDVVHAPPSGLQTPLAEPEQRSRGLESSRSSASRGRTKEKGKEKERVAENGHTTEGTSTRSSSIGKIGETLSSVWGAPEASPAKSPTTLREGRSRLGSVAEVPSVSNINVPPPPAPAAPVDTPRSLGIAPSLSSKRGSPSVRSVAPSVSQSVASEATPSRRTSTVHSPRHSTSTPAHTAETVAPAAPTSLHLL
ncbi:hypothetical protein CPB85DRAFT_201484 [Mucidula mucida]|nr:hypothetical protein CPB85DRAFT_201484 [Mucidula mucida]